MEPRAFGLHDVATGDSGESYYYESYYCKAKGLKNRVWVSDKDD